MASQVLCGPRWPIEAALSQTILLVVIIHAFINFAMKHQICRAETASDYAQPAEHEQLPLPNGDGVRSHRVIWFIRCLRKQPYKWNIQIESDRSHLKLAVALLDTGCHEGNWVSTQLLQRIGKLSEIQTLSDAPLIQAVDGSSIIAQGRISLEWKRQQGNNFYETNFYVFPPEAMNIDVIFGSQYISEKKLLVPNENAMLPMLQSNKSINSGKLERS